MGTAMAGGEGRGAAGRRGARGRGGEEKRGSGLRAAWWRRAGRACALALAGVRDAARFGWVERGARGRAAVGRGCGNGVVVACEWAALPACLPARCLPAVTPPLCSPARGRVLSSGNEFIYVTATFSSIYFDERNMALSLLPGWPLAYVLHCLVFFVPKHFFCSPLESNEIA